MSINSNTGSEIFVVSLKLFLDIQGLGVLDSMLLDILRIYANIFVERDSQKGIIIGAKGSRLKQIGTDSRVQIERLVQRKVFLDLRVKLAKDWQRDPKKLERLGF